MNTEKKSKSKRRGWNEDFWGLLFVLPTISGLVILNIYPIIETVRKSFFKAGDFGRGDIFVGFSNYEKMLKSKEVWQALFNTIKYAIVEVPFSIILALILAVFLNKKLKFRSVYRTLYFLPMVCAPAAIAMVWKWLLNSEFGLINNMFKVNIKWTSDPKIAVFTMAVIGIWTIIGYNIVLFLAGLQEVPTDFYEAAAIDGASEVDKFFNITVPLISPTLFFVCVIRVIASLQVFDFIFIIMERDNPALYKTQSLVYLFFRESFVKKNDGYGSAIVVLLMLIIMIITAIQVHAQKKWVHYN